MDSTFSPPHPAPAGPEALAARLDASAGFQLLARALVDVPVVLDGDETVVYAGAKAEAELGVPADRLVGRPFRSLVCPSDLDVLPPRLRSGGGLWEVRLRVAGVEGWVNFSTADLGAVVGDGVEEEVGPLGGYLLLLVRSVGPRGVSRDWFDVLRRTVDATGDLVVVSDARQRDHPIVFANERFFQTTGYSREEVLGQNCRFLQTRPDGTRDDDQDGVHELRRAIGRGEGAHVVIRNYKKNGERFYNQLHLMPLRGGAGEVTHFVGFQNDVTDLVETRAERDDRARLLRAFYDNVPLLAGVLERRDGDLVHRSVNAPAAELFGVEPAAAAGQTLEAIGFTEAEAETWRRRVRRCLETGTSDRFQTVYPWGSTPGAEGVRDLEVVLAPADGELALYVAEDVTERRRLELEQVERTAALEQAADAVVITGGSLDRPGPVIHYVNRAFEEMTGRSREEVLGRDPRFMQGPLTDRAELDRMRRELAAGRPYRGELINVRKDGTPYAFEIEIVPVRDASCEVVRYVSTQRDVTARRRLEAEVLSASTRAQEQIARDLHDGVGQLLTGTAFHLHSLARDLEAEGSASASRAARAAELVQEAQRQARALAHGIFPNVVGGGLAVELERLAEETAATYGVRCDFADDDVVAVEPPERAVDLYRIAQEAVANAVRHGAPRAVQIRLSGPPVDDEGGGPAGSDFARLTVEDDGCGISNEALEEGQGIGLNSMRYRARRLGGSIEVVRRAGGGTAVRVHFPVHGQIGAAAGDGARSEEVA